MALTQLALLFLVLTTQAQEPYRMTRIDANPGLYFERAHSIRFRRADWRVALVIDIAKLENEFPQEYTNLNVIYQRCLKFPVKLECSSVLRTHYLNGRIKEALEKHAEIKTLLSEIGLSIKEEDAPPKTIVRRSAPFGFVGTLSRTLFGTLDITDAEYFDSQIDKLYADQRKITQLVKNQTHLVMSDLHNVHNLIAELMNSVKDNRVKINELVEILNEDMLLNYTVILSQYASSIENSLNHYISAAEDFISMLSSAQDGKLHPSLLSNCKLKVLIDEIHNSATHYEVPIPRNYLRVEEIVKISQVTLEHRSGRILVTIHLPLVNRIEYHLYRLHSLPILQNLSDNTNVWASISPQYSYLGLSNDHSTYFGTTETFLNSCKQTWYLHLCDLGVPLHDVSVTELCEISLLLRPHKKSLQTCNIKLATFHESQWHRLKYTGGWLYSTKEPESLQILCKNQADILETIQGTGIIEIRPDCVVKTRSTTLIGTPTFTNIEQFLYNPNLLLNISEVFPNVGRSHLIESLSNYQPSYSEQDAGNTIGSLHEIEEELGRLEVHHREKRFHFGLTYGTIAAQAVIILGLIIFYFWKSTSTLEWMTRLCRRGRRPTSTANETAAIPLETLATVATHPLPPRIVVN